MIRSLHEGLGIPYESLISKRLKNKSIEHVAAPAIDRLNTLGFEVAREGIPAFLSTVVQSNSAPALHRKTRTQLHYDQLLDQGSAFVDDMEIHSEDVYEREADQLARESLIPSSVLSQIRWDEDITQDEIVAVAVRARVHVAIAAGRWQRDHQNYKKFARLIERDTVRAAFKST
jgi:hypothetical protein